MKLAATTLALLLAAVSPAGATVIEVPVPGLLGTYSEETRSALVTLPSKPSVIHSVSVRVHGTGVGQGYLCDGENGMQPVVLPPMVEFLFNVPPGGWSAMNLDPNEGTISWTRPFEPYRATWDFFLDGSATLSLSVNTDSAILECYPTGPPGTATFDEVTLIIDADFPTPARNATWGRLKSIYR